MGDRSDLTVRVEDGRFAIARLAGDAPRPSWAAGALVAVVRTPDELSVVCRDDAVPPSIDASRGWRLLSVVGPLDLDEIGVLDSLAGPLAGAGVPVFVISTYDTDHVLVPGDRVVDARHALTRAGVDITEP